jgi:hypothetical protein
MGSEIKKRKKEKKKKRLKKMSARTTPKKKERRQDKTIRSLTWWTNATEGIPICTRQHTINSVTHCTNSTPRSIKTTL